MCSSLILNENVHLRLKTQNLRKGKLDSCWDTRLLTIKHLTLIRQQYQYIIGRKDTISSAWCPSTDPSIHQCTWTLRKALNYCILALEQMCGISGKYAGVVLLQNGDYAALGFKRGSRSVRCAQWIKIQPHTAVCAPYVNACMEFLHVLRCGAGSGQRDPTCALCSS